MTKFVLTDVDGETSYSSEKLTAYVFERMETFIKKNKEQPEVQAILTALSAEMKSGLSLKAASNTFKSWLKENKEHELLKEIYELICKDGLRAGDLKNLEN